MLIQFAVCKRALFRAFQESQSGNMSCEPYRKKRYDPDLRWRMVFQRKVMGLSVRQNSKNLNVDQSTIRQIEKVFDQTGSVDFKSYPQSHRDGHKKLSQADEYFILQLAVEMPGIYLRVIQHELWVTNGTAVSEETVMRFLKTSGFTRKKLQRTAIQHSEDTRA